MRFISIDVGGSYIKFGILDHYGNFIKSNKIVTPKSLELFLCELHKLIESELNQIKGVGISLPGKIDTKSGKVYFGGALTYLHDFNLKENIERKFNIRCELTNDGKAAALAELWLGNLKNVKNGCAVILGTGVGGGIIINGSLYQGTHFQAGELSFMTNSNSLHDESGIVGVSHSAVEFVRKSAEIIGIEKKIDGHVVFEEIKTNNNIELLKLFDEYCESIANLIINIQAVIDVSDIVIGGGISEQAILIDTIREKYIEIRKRIELVDFMLPKVKIQACKFRSEANLIGAMYPFIKYE